LDCSPQNRGLQHFYTGAPKDLWVGMHRAGPSLLLKMPRLSVQHMHTKTRCPALPRNTSCVIQLGALRHTCSEASDAQKHCTCCTGATRSSSIPVQDAWDTSQLHCCCCILATKHLDNTAGSGYDAHLPPSHNPALLLLASDADNCKLAQFWQILFTWTPHLIDEETLT